MPVRTTDRKGRYRTEVFALLFRAFHQPGSTAEPPYDVGNATVGLWNDSPIGYDRSVLKLDQRRHWKGCALEADDPLREGSRVPVCSRLSVELILQICGQEQRVTEAVRFDAR
eukprot:1718377-Rhodomonas_salina.2